jgi:hypothetical protein
VLISPSIFLKKVITNQSCVTAPLFVVKISPPFGDFTAPLHHILPINNITIKSNNLFVNFHWMFTFCVEKPYDGMHLDFGGTLDSAPPFQTRLTQTKPVLPLPN